VEITSLVSGGNGLATLPDGMVVFVSETVPGDRASIRLTKRKNHYAQAQLISLLEPSPDRCAPACPHAGDCGGCKWQMIRYETQLHAKEQILAGAFQHLGGFRDSLPLLPIMGAPDPLHYRNKMEFSFGGNLDQLTLGLHYSGSWAGVFDTTGCLLGPAPMMDFLGLIRSRAQELKLISYHNIKHTGTLRFAIIRYSWSRDEWLLTLITTDQQPCEVEQLLDYLAGQLPKNLSLVHGISLNYAAIATADRYRTITGAGFIRENLNNIQFQIGPQTFFQSNPLQAEHLFNRAMELAELNSQDRVLELFCGVGAISLIMASHVESVCGVEMVEASVQMAEENCKRQGIANCRFIQADVGKLSPTLFDTNFTTVVVDPPRPGVPPSAIQLIHRIAPVKIIYISCNPDTLARDASFICQGGRYRLAALQPVDMFPQTPHIESIALFHRVSA